jgi:RNA polymerase primary sigma factor
MLKLSRQYTNHDGKSIDRYLQEISKVELLTAKEEIQLAKKIRKGDRKAFEQLVKANLRFVVTVAKQYQSQGLSLGDLINEGNIGLIKAARRFDETRGFKFISYAVWWIRQAILQALGERGRVVRLPLNRIGILSKIRNMNSEFEQNFGREPMAEEIAEMLKVKDQDISEAIQIAGKNISIDAPLKSTEDNNLHSLLTNNSDSNPDDLLLKDSLKEEIDNSLKALSKREADILKLYFGLDCDHAFTLEDIGQRFHLTRERVRQIKEKAIRRLRHKKRAERLRKYLG